MPWKERYTISDEKSILDTEIKWPDGKRCCFRVVVDLSPACGPDGIQAADLTTPDAYFGMHGGLKELCGVLERRGLKATFFLTEENMQARLADWVAVAREGHEVANHTVTHPCSLGRFSASRFEHNELDRMEGFLATTEASLLAGFRCFREPRVDLQPGPIDFR